SANSNHNNFFTCYRKLSKQQSPLFSRWFNPEKQRTVHIDKLHLLGTPPSRVIIAIPIRSQITEDFTNPFR
ncbi:unnamed protein product, partial [Onchocerca ochengi]|uniref:Ovule protein n=1 Tax=Onchocerca ochengi TaxID=42157 RepID=A0A182EZ05_ONCOC